MFDRKKKEPLLVPVSQKQDVGAKRQVIGGRPVGEKTPDEAKPSTPPVRTPAPVKSQRVSEASTLGPSVSLEGNLKFTGTLVVNCKVRGSIESTDHLVVGSSADIEADVLTGTAEISGKLVGNVKAMNTVRILRGGMVYGDIETPTISMEEGVVFEGRCTRPDDSSSKPSAVVQPMMETVAASSDSEDSPSESTSDN